MSAFKSLCRVSALLALSACATTSNEHDPYQDLGILWVKHSAEYQALTLQVYRCTRRFTSITRRYTVECNDGIRRAISTAGSRYPGHR